MDAATVDELIHEPINESIRGKDASIYREMLSHTPLFAHRKPQTVAIIGDQDRGIQDEVLKHLTVTHVWQLTDQKQPGDGVHARVHSLSPGSFTQIQPDSLDVLIIAQAASHSDFSSLFAALKSDGILIQLSESPFEVDSLKTIQQQLQTTGFRDTQALHFPQPAFKSGWRSAIMATKQGTIKRPREKDIFNKPFITHYYNFDMHKAAFALPEFMRALLN